MTITYTPTQQLLMDSECTTTLYGGARGGGKTYAVSGNKAILHVREFYSEEEADEYGLDITQYRCLENENGSKVFYKVSIDYPQYKCVIVRKTEPQLMATVHPECEKIYPTFGGTYIRSERTWRFPSGAQVMYKSVEKESALSFFKSGNFTMLIIEELTEFKKEWVEIMEGGCRSADPILKAMKVYTTNPGDIGHRWVKEKYINPCPPLPNGNPVYSKEFDISYQPLKPNAPAKTATGETFLFIPSLIFDNPFLFENDPDYVRNLLGKNEILRQMWLYGNWDVFAGQFFDNFDYEKHVVDEAVFYKAIPGDHASLAYKRSTFDWTNYRLFRSYDYGYGAPWVCLFWAVHRFTGDVVLLKTMNQTKLTARMQARLVNEITAAEYNLTVDNFEREVADPKSYWENIDTGDMFMTAWDYYAEENIILQKANNKREQGALAVLEFLRIREDGTPRLTILSNNEYTIDTIVNLPADPKNLNDVDTRAEDHAYDAARYFLLGLKEDFKFSDDESEERKSWRDDFGESDNMLCEGAWKAI